MITNPQPSQSDAWRNLMWHAYITKIKSPNWAKYLHALRMFPIAGYTSSDSLSKRSQIPFDEASSCVCLVCVEKRRKQFKT